MKSEQLSNVAINLYEVTWHWLEWLFSEQINKQVCSDWIYLGHNIMVMKNMVKT